jgi:hypothetical protein
VELPIANKIEQPIFEEDENMKCVGCNKVLQIVEVTYLD